MADTFRSVRALAAHVAKDPSLADQISKNPQEALARLAAPLERDHWIYRIVVTGIVLIAMGCIGGIIALAYVNPENVPDALTAIASAAVGALAGLLAPSPARN